MTGSERMVMALALAKKHGVAVIEDNCERHSNEVVLDLERIGAVGCGVMPARYEAGHGWILHADDGLVHKTYNTSLSIGKDCTSRGVPWVDFDGRIAKHADPRCPECFPIRSCKPAEV